MFICFVVCKVFCGSTKCGVKECRLSNNYGTWLLSEHSYTEVERMTQIRESTLVREIR